MDTDIPSFVFKTKIQLDSALIASLEESFPFPTANLCGLYTGNPSSYNIRIVPMMTNIHPTKYNTSAREEKEFLFV